MEISKVPRWARVEALPDYEVVDADLEHACDDVVNVWGNTDGWPGQHDKIYRRYYQQHPHETPMLKFLCHKPSGQIVGTLGVSPRRVSWNGRRIRAGMLSHLYLRHAHRKIAPPLLLFRAAVLACQDRFDVIYAMPRSDKAEALAKLSGIPRAFDIVRCVRLLRYGHYVERKLPRQLARVAGAVLDAGAVAYAAMRRLGTRGLVAQWTDRVDPRMSELWSRTPVASGWNTHRDEAMLRWRFDLLLALERRYLLLSDAADGSLLGWFACHTSGFDDKMLVVQDFWSTGGLAGIDGALLHALCREARALGFAGVETRVPESCVLAWRKAGFRERNRYPVLVPWMSAQMAGADTATFRMTDLDCDS